MRRVCRIPCAGLALAIAAALAPALRSQPAGASLTLEDCLRLAESAPSAVTLAQLEREIAARDVSQAKAAFLPQSRLVSGFTYNSPLLHDRHTVSFLPLNGIREYSSLATVTQELDASGRLRAELARARAVRDAAAASAAIARRDLRRAVTGAYVRALLAARIAEVMESALAESRVFEQRVRLLFQNGEAARADVVKAAAQTAAMEQAVNAARLDAQLARQELLQFWTSDVTQPVQLADALEAAPPPPDAEGAPYRGRLEFRLLDLEQQGFRADYRRARSALLPQLGLSYQYGIDSTALRIRDRGYAVFANLSVTLFDWNRARSAMQQARLRAQQTEAKRAMAERAFSKDYQAALERARQLYAQIALTRRQAEMAAEDLRLSRIRYEGGEGLALDVVTAQNMLAQARSNYYTALANYRLALADLEVAAGR